MSEISGQRVHADALVRLREAVKALERLVRAAVIDEAYTPYGVDPTEDTGELRVEPLDDRGLVMTRHDDRQRIRRRLHSRRVHRAALLSATERQPERLEIRSHPRIAPAAENRCSLEQVPANRPLRVDPRAARRIPHRLPASSTPRPRLETSSSALSSPQTVDA